MKKVMAAMLLALAAIMFMAVGGHSAEALKCLGIVKSVDKARGEMVLKELDTQSLKPTGKDITVTDKVKGRLAKNKGLVKNVKVHVTYEKDGDDNVVRGPVPDFV